jgi:hypothetical protein
MAFAISRIAAGWSPVGLYGDSILKSICREDYYFMGLAYFFA